MERKPKNEQARFEKKVADTGIMHNADLHDEDSFDEATGKVRDNSSTVSNPLERLHIVEPTGVDDVLGALPQEDDAAARWLRENDKGGSPES